MSKNDDVWKQLRNNDNSGMTVFAPTDDAMSALGEKRLVQLRDNRNEEMVQRMAAFHAVNEAVPVTQLFDSAGVVPLAKEVVVVDRSSTGGMFGVGGQEDGGVIVGGARVVSTLVLAGDGNAKEQILVHATDGLVSPKMLWRYCDQLRIPGSQ